MKKIFAFVILLLAAWGAYIFWSKNTKSETGEPNQPLTLKKHSLLFNTSIVNVMNAYFEMKDAFVVADTNKAKFACKKFIGLLDSIKLEELKKDTASIYETAQSNLVDVKSNALSLLNQTNITEMRHDFRMVSEMLYPSFFNSINYEGPKMYWQNCNSAFGEGKEANWISKTTEIENPFLGKADLHLGEIKDTIKTR